MHQGQKHLKPIVFSISTPLPILFIIKIEEITEISSRYSLVFVEQQKISAFENICY